MTVRVRHTLHSDRSGRRAFTLTELLVVIAIIVIMLALAVPLFNILHGGRSVDAGQNIVAGMLQRARARAIWTQERRGVFFFHDQLGSGKTAMLMVRVLDDGQTLELDPDNAELEFLPTGIDAAFMRPPLSNAGTTSTDYRPFGLVLFDGLGRAEAIGNYKLYINPATALLNQYGLNIEQPGGTVISGLGTSPPPAPQESSSVAFTLYDNTKMGDVGGAISGTTFSPQQQTWLEQNGVALVVNRYNGTLFRGE